MEVTRTNFAELCPEIEKDIKSCSFLAVDGEFTGLNNGPSNISPFDTPAQYYTKVLSGSLDFLFVQFGLSIFRHVSDFKYENKTYIFYLFPEPMNRDAPDRRFLCQTSSLSFLAKHGFDFNKLIKEGIPYLKQCDESALREAMEARKKMWAANLASPSHIEIPPAQKPLVDEVMSKIKELLTPECDKDVVRVEKCSAFVRKLVYQTVREDLPDSNITVETEKGVLVARRGIEKGQLEQEKQKKADSEESEIQNAVGFVSIMKMIINSGKLMVGHNFLLDLCHIIHQFIDHLPRDYLEFKDMVNSLFPKIVDTKFLCSEGPLKDLFPSTILSSVLETVSKPPFQLPEIVHVQDRSYDLSAEKYHDSGYDAYVTGVSFLSALRYLESNGEKVHNVNSPLLNNILNRLHLMRISDTCINLGGKDPFGCFFLAEPARNHVFHVTFPKNWTSQHLNDLFFPFGSIQISWISDTAAWISLYERQKAERVKKAFQAESSAVTVIPYDRFQASLRSPSATPTSTSVSSSSTSMKRKLQRGSGRGQEAEGTPGPQNKRLRSLSSDRLEATQGNNGKAPGINTLETVSMESSSQNFPVNDNWD